MISVKNLSKVLYDFTFCKWNKLWWDRFIGEIIEIKFYFDDIEMPISFVPFFFPQEKAFIHNLQFNSIFDYLTISK